MVELVVEGIYGFGNLLGSRVELVASSPVHLEGVAPLLPPHSLPAWDHYYYSAANLVEHPQAEDDYLGEGTHVLLAAQLLTVTPDIFVNA